MSNCNKKEYTKLMADPGTATRLFGGKTGEALLRAISYTMSANVSVGGVASRGYPGYFGDAGTHIRKTKMFDPQAARYFDDSRQFFHQLGIED